MRVKEREIKTGFGDLVNAEVRWSADSKAFFLTYSDGGSIGTYHVEVVYVNDDSLHEIEPVPAAESCPLQGASTRNRPTSGQ